MPVVVAGRAVGNMRNNIPLLFFLNTQAPPRPHASPGDLCGLPDSQVCKERIQQYIFPFRPLDPSWLQPRHGCLAEWSKALDSSPAGLD